LPDAEALESDREVDMKVSQSSACGLMLLKNEPDPYYMRIFSVAEPIEIRHCDKSYESNLSAWLELYSEWTPTPWEKGLNTLYEAIKNEM